MSDSQLWWNQSLTVVCAGQQQNRTAEVLRNQTSALPPHLKDQRTVNGASAHVQVFSEAAELRMGSKRIWARELSKDCDVQCWEKRCYLALPTVITRYQSITHNTSTADASLIFLNTGCSTSTEMKVSMLTSEDSFHLRPFYIFNFTYIFVRSTLKSRDSTHHVFEMIVTARQMVPSFISQELIHASLLTINAFKV